MNLPATEIERSETPAQRRLESVILRALQNAGRISAYVGRDTKVETVLEREGMRLYGITVGPGQHVCNANTYDVHANELYVTVQRGLLQSERRQPRIVVYAFDVTDEGLVLRKTI